MADWMAGLAGGFGGASDFLRTLMAQKERDRDRNREDDRFNKQFTRQGTERAEDIAFREGQERRSADQFTRNLAYMQQQQDALERDRKAQDVVDFGRASGVNYRDPRRVSQMQDIAQLPSGVGGMGMPDVSGMLGQLGRGAETGTTSAINQALADASRSNQAGRALSTPMGQVFVENRQFRPTTPSESGTETMSRYATAVTNYKNSERLDRTEIAGRIKASMPQIVNKYGTALLSSDPTIRAEAERAADLEFGPDIEREVNKQMEHRRQGMVQTLRTSFPGVPPAEIHKAIYGTDMPGTSLMDIIREEAAKMGGNRR